MVWGVGGGRGLRMRRPRWPASTCNARPRACLHTRTLPSLPPSQVVAEDTNDEWSIHRPRELKPGSFGPPIYKDLVGRGVPIKEKNWMPFVHQDQLYMTHSVVPHRVFRCGAGRWAGRGVERVGGWGWGRRAQGAICVVGARRLAQVGPLGEHRILKRARPPTRHVASTGSTARASRCSSL